MEKIPWYKSNSLRGLLLAGISFAAQKLGIAETVDDQFIASLIDNAFTVIEAIGIIWATYARTRMATPPVSDAAVQATLKRQGGFASVGVLITTMLVALAGASLLSGCAGTTAAYKAASSPDDYAYVTLEHYDALLKEAVALKNKPGVSPEVVEALKTADAKVFPVAQKVKQARDVYNAVKSADNEEALQAAVNDAVLLIVDFINVIKQARGEL